MTWWLAQHLVMTAALAAAVLAVSRLVHLGPVARHALWLVVLVKFMVPPVVEWPWAVPDPFGISRVTPAGSATHDPTQGTLDEITHSSEWYVENGLASIETTDPTAAGSFPELPLWQWLSAIWLLGSVALLAVEGVRIRRVTRRLKLSHAAQPQLTARVARLAERLGMALIEVRVVPGAAPPAVWGLGRPRLLWPADWPAQASDACLDGLIVHELAHVKRGDHLVGWLELAAGVVWWWNPLFWYVRSALREQAELACDAWVISTLPDGRRAYAESLLAASGAPLAPAPSMALVGIGPTNRRMLERRLVMIMQGRASVRLTRVGLLCLALVAAAVLPGWAAQTQDPPPPPPDPPKVVPVTRPMPGLPTPAVRPVVTPPTPSVATPVVRPGTTPPVRPVAVPPTPRSSTTQPVVVVDGPRPEGARPIATPTVPQVMPAPPPAAPPGTVPVVRPGAPPRSMPPPPPPAVAVPSPVAAAPTQVASGRIQGMVTDAAGTPMGGVQITLGSDALVRPMVDVTAVSGRFDFPIVPIGTYTVTYDLPGYKRLVRPGIVIERGFNATVNAQLEPGVSDATTPAALPAEGATLVAEFERERAAIQAEADREIDLQRQALIRSLEDLAAQLTAGGHVDQAEAIRDAIRRLQGTRWRLVR